MDPTVFAEILSQLIESGFHLPIRATAVAISGYFMVAEYSENESEDGIECSVLASNEYGVVGPVNMMFVDVSGKGAHVVIQNPQDPRNQMN